MDFKKRVPFGRTGLMVSRIGLASGFGAPTAAIEKAFHEYGVNYFWLAKAGVAIMKKRLIYFLVNQKTENFETR
jgi:hypothetical protein